MTNTLGKIGWYQILTINCSNVSVSSSVPNTWIGNPSTLTCTSYCPGESDEICNYSFSNMMLCCPYNIQSLQKNLLPISSGYMKWSEKALVHIHQTKHCLTPPPFPPRYQYFYRVVGTVWSNDPESYAGSSNATGRTSHARQLKTDQPDTKEHSGTPGWVFG